MSIWQKIKSWWIAYQENRRQWWAAPALHVAHFYQEKNEQKIQALENELHSSVADLRRTLGDSVKLTEDNLFHRLKEQRHHLDTIEDDIRKSEEHLVRTLQELTGQLNGIRSRYQWVEDRYNDMAKGKVPREFDYEHRQ